LEKYDDQKHQTLANPYFAKACEGTSTKGAKK
jgi:hypothetical protein